VVVGIEATGAMQWFLELLEELGVECRVGHPAKIRAAETRKQKHDRRDARLELNLPLEDRFPALWMPSTEQRDLRTLLRDRHQWVKIRTRVENTLQAIALNHGLRRGRGLWSQAGQAALRALPVPPYTSQRRDELLSLHAQLHKRIQELDRQVEEQARQRTQALRLLTHPGVGPVTALATEVFLGDARRFENGKAVASYIGMIPCEHSCGKRQRLGKLSKEGNSLLRYLWTEAAMHAVRKDPELKRFYRRKLIFPASCSSFGTDCRAIAAAPPGSSSAQQQGRLWVELLPAYAPELNPVEYLWSHWKQHELPNLCPQNFGQLSHYARKALRRMRQRPSLVIAFWRQAELFPL
jgi:transposase